MGEENKVKRIQPSYQESLDYLYGLEKYGMILGLTQVTQILEAIGNPHQTLQSVHVGGTNGKGSTAAMMAAILQKEGYRVGLYTSPHLIHFTERIKVDGQEIEPEEVAALAGWMRERVEAAGISSPYTFFDFTTAMALLYFSQKMVDLAVLEVGLGGRLDSTNVVDPLLTIITNVTRDHVDVLGKGIIKIATEKGGIIKKGRPLITAARQAPVIRLFSKICQEKGAPLYRVGRDFRYTEAGARDFHYEGLHRKLWDVRLSLSGSHQIINATTALGAMEILEELGFPVSTSAMMEGLGSVEWPGRLEMVTSSPQVLLDGAHNLAGAQFLKEALAKEFQFRRLILLIGILKDKDVQGILQTLAPVADHLILSQPSIERAAPAAFLKQALRLNGKKSDIVENLQEAIQKGLTMTGPEDLLCITGSLYMVGEAKAFFQLRGRP